MKRTKTNEYPRVIKHGSSEVRITRTMNRGRPSYVVSYVAAGRGRVQARFTDEEKAQREAESRAKLLAEGDLQALKLTGEDRSLYVTAEAALRECGVSLLTAARDFADAYKLLGGNFIVEAARFYAPRRAGITRVTVADAVAKYRDAKEREGLSAKYLRDLRVILNAFTKAFQCHLDSVTAEDLRAYLNGRGGGNLARNNHRRVLVGFFSFAKGEKWIPAGEPTAAELVATWKVKDKDVEIFTPDEIEALLTHAGPSFLPWVALLAFAGVRREELAKGLQWSSIDFAKGVLIVPAAIAKTGKKRKITLAENVREWLAPYRRSTGPICALKDTAVQKEIERVCAAAEVTWKANALRHSYGSYAMERTKNAGEVSLTMGNSAGVVLKHYHEIVDTEDAERFWDIKPRRPANVVEMSKVA